MIVRAKHGHALIGEWLTLLTDLVHLCTEAAGWLLRYVGTVTGLGHPRRAVCCAMSALLLGYWVRVGVQTTGSRR
eukprot:COSAG01_NODE_7060_length_3371_cov_1.308068_3_plen_75_part_00